MWRGRMTSSHRVRIDGRQFRENQDTQELILRTFVPRSEGGGMHEMR